ncbi:FBP domain-containing protein [Streptomyces yaizuensis]|uniref:FBP domain-containing protein n=1 Tax=Streptomyces yaizuensis TaxID=2989713 RepID=A0ABQ5P328_9ACTN|nr:FBP domain-containing protein [Streptomyces sp. YSPA8]GLF97008.1 FBP domain-containing protein [Streptomyces sp. YSPA8]
MEPLTETQIRKSLVNCSKGEANRLRLPTGFPGLDWDDLDFLGWIDPGAPLRAALVAPGEDGPVGVVLRVPAVSSTSAVRSSLCSICFTGHAASGVNLFVAPLAGARGREGDSAGIYICADLACSLYLRGKRQPALRTRRQEESLTTEERSARALGNLAGFLAKVRSTA